MKAPTIYVGVERVTPEDERLGANLLLATIRGTLAYGMAWGETAKRGDRLHFTTERERRGATVTLSARLMRLDDEGCVVSIFGSSHDSRPSARLGLPVRTTRLLPPGVVLADGSVLTVGPPAKLADRRLLSLRDHVAIAFDRTDRPVELVVIEGPVVRSSAAVVIGMVHGVMRADLLDRRIPYAIVPPATLKKYATGKGNADKTAMALALYKRTGLEFDDDNQVDAWWLRAAGLHHLGCPIVDVPQAQADALAKVEWPALDEMDGVA